MIMNMPLIGTMYYIMDTACSKVLSTTLGQIGVLNVWKEAT